MNRFFERILMTKPKSPRKPRAVKAPPVALAPETIQPPAPHVTPAPSGLIQSALARLGLWS